MLTYPFSQFSVNIYTLLVDFITYFCRCVYILVGIKEKRKSFCLLDFRLILEGWVVGFEPTTFRTTSGISCTCNILIYSDFIICYLCPAKYMLKFLHTTEYLKYVRNQLYRNILWLIFFWLIDWNKMEVVITLWWLGNEFYRTHILCDNTIHLAIE